ncbi:hemerythrin domain-containing protein [Microbispora sp. H10670]|uniref:hemerythrin domain-containing protein n=1 Tax=Microbispora sp. H10670 TaxID=2729108 RepID=UPI001602D333|nr:hemerythrin domain-containing protein [Microbispora sp. H10670]
MATDVIGLIKEDHRDVESLFERLQKMPENRPALLAELAAKFIAHSEGEEDVVYPLLARRRPEEKEEVHHGAEEHHEAEEMLSRLLESDPESTEFDTLLRELVAAVSHHVEEEETDILPVLEQAVSLEERVRAGKAFSRRKAEVLAKPIKPRSRTREELLHQAKELELEGASGMTKDELVAAIRQKKQQG